MTVPTSYTEVTLGAYMKAVLGAVGTSLGLTDTGLTGDYIEAVYETLFAYGVSDIASATDIKKLRALARVQAWQLALNEVSADYDFSDGGASYNRSQAFEKIKENLALAQSDAMQYTYDYTIEVESVDYTENPYEYYEADDRLDMRI